MSKVIIDFSMIGDPVNMMQTLQREVAKACVEMEKDSEPIQKEIMEAPTIAQIEGILKREFGDKLKIRDKYRATNNQA
jgi:hypothetical protein